MNARQYLFSLAFFCCALSLRGQTIDQTAFIDLVKSSKYLEVSAFLHSHPKVVDESLLSPEMHPLLLAIRNVDRKMIKVLLSERFPTFIATSEFHESHFVLRDVLDRNRPDGRKLAIWLYDNGYPIDDSYVSSNWNDVFQSNDLATCIMTGSVEVAQYLISKGYDTKKMMVLDGNGEFEMDGYLGYLAQYGYPDADCLALYKLLVGAGLPVNSTSAENTYGSVGRQGDDNFRAYRRVLQHSLLDMADERVQRSDPGGLNTQTIIAIRDFLVSKGALPLSEMLSRKDYQSIVGFKAEVTDDNVRIRSAPGLSGEILGKLTRQEVTVLLTEDVDDTGDIWHLVRAPNGLYGWMNGQFIDVPADPIKDYSSAIKGRRRHSMERSDHWIDY